MEQNRLQGNPTCKNQSQYFISVLECTDDIEEHFSHKFGLNSGSQRKIPITQKDGQRSELHLRQFSHC